MISTKCPGQDMRYWTADDIHEEKCPQCGEMIEFFKTDIRMRCPNCKTRMANPKFNMGCAQWCAYAEQCLGPAARGLKGKSMRSVFEEVIEKRLKDHPDKRAIAKASLADAEKRCLEIKADLLPVVAAIVIITLKRLELLNNADELFTAIETDTVLPQQAVKEAKEVAENVITGNIEGTLEKIVSELVR